MAAPLIGVTTFRTYNPEKKLGYISVTEAYIEALLQAGAAPVLVPLGLPEPAWQALLSVLQGVLFTGGGDIAPERYGAAPDPRAEDIDPQRDEIEIALVRAAADSGLPFLGICRGLQTVNVALGGTLYADIHAQHPAALEHACFKSAPRTWPAHSVRVESGSRLATIVGSGELQVNSGHHQAVRNLAPGLVSTALASDGIIEAIELGQHPFGLAVQWHPEWLLAHAPMPALFRAFVEAAASAGRAPRLPHQQVHVPDNEPHRYL